MGGLGLVNSPAPLTKKCTANTFPHFERCMHFVCCNAWVWAALHHDYQVHIPSCLEDLQ